MPQTRQGFQGISVRKTPQKCVFMARAANFICLNKCICNKYVFTFQSYHCFVFDQTTHSPFKNSRLLTANYCSSPLGKFLVGDDWG